VVTTSAQRELRKTDPQVRKTLIAAIHELGGDPYQPSAKRLVGDADVWRVRVGDYRILYAVVDERLIVTVIRVGHRRQVYDR
jgi:mRNA interferase RelE/StbE